MTSDQLAHYTHTHTHTHTDGTPAVRLNKFSVTSSDPADLVLAAAVFNIFVVPCVTAIREGTFSYKEW